EISGDPIVAPPLPEPDMSEPSPSGTSGPGSGSPTPGFSSGPSPGMGGSGPMAPPAPPGRHRPQDCTPRCSGMRAATLTAPGQMGVQDLGILGHGMAGP